jgi:hypothetical protein
MLGQRRGADEERESDEPAGRQQSKRGGHRLLKLAALGGAVALLVREDVRNQLLDLLFGAEEEFDYSSLTEPSEAAPGHSPSEPWVRQSDPVPEPQTPPEYQFETPSEHQAEAPTEHQPPPENQTETPPDYQAEAPPDYEPGSSSTVGEPPRAVRITTSIAPGPEAWRAAEREHEQAPVPTSEPADPDQGTGEPPALPPRWWAPSSPGDEPADS